MEDHDIIKKCQAGRMDDFAKLYDKYIEKIYAFVYYKTHHKETAEDLVSLVFTKAVKNIATFDTKAGTFQAWLYQIARNTVIDHYRTRKSELDISDIWDMTDGSDIEKDIDIKQKMEKLESYLAMLKSEHRDILIMKLWQGMSYKEIASVLDKSEASCKMMFSRTIRKLKEEMPAEAFLALLLMGFKIV